MAPARTRNGRFVTPLLATALAAVVVVGVGGFLHTHVGRPLLALLAGAHCPFARGSVDPHTRDTLRRLGLSRAAHLPRAAPARPALGFELGAANRADVTEWAAARGLSCHVESAGSGLACAGVPGRLLGGEDDARGSAYFRFDAGGRLVGVLRMQRTTDVSQALALGRAAQGELTQKLGAPTRRSGALTLALASGPLRQSRAEHRFDDFSATTSVTNLGAEGYLFVAEAELL